MTEQSRFTVEVAARVLAALQDGRMTEVQLRHLLQVGRTRLSGALSYGRQRGMFDRRNEARIVWWGTHEQIAKMAAESKERDRQAANERNQKRKLRIRRGEWEPTELEHDCSGWEPQRNIVKAGTIPPPRTKAPRSVFELGAM